MKNYDEFYEEVKGFEIPSPFFIEDNKLYREHGKKEEFEFISRQVPYITKYFDDFEENNVQYELKWFIDGKIYNEIIHAIALASKREVILLSIKGMSCDDKNVCCVIYCYVHI